LVKANGKQTIEKLILRPKRENPLKHAACEGCEFEGHCLTERMDMEADCPNVINWEAERDEDDYDRDHADWINDPDMGDQ
jgi:hypothetical protein